MSFLFDPRFQAVDANGLPLSGAILNFYQAGTSTKITAYQDSAATTPHLTSGVVADSTGTFAPIFLTTTADYKFILKNAGGTTVQTVDGIQWTGTQWTGEVPDGSVTNDSVAVGADIDVSKLGDVTPGGTGGANRTVIEVLRDRPPNVAWYGVLGNGVSSSGTDTAKLNAALLAHRAVYIPPGMDIRTTDTIQVQPGGEIWGQDYEACRINRHASFTGPTIQIGTEATSSGAFHIRGLFIDNPHPSFDAATSTTLGSNRLVGQQAHIMVWGGTQGLIERCYIQNAVFNVDVAGHTGLTIRECLMLGVWDAENTDRQECRANIRLGRTAGLAYTTEALIYNNYLAGVSNVSRTINMSGSSGTFVARLDGGPRFGVQIDAAEGAKIFNNYIGANNEHGVFVFPASGSIATNIDINGNFFDGARISSINLTAASGAQNNLIAIRGNRFNGQEITPHVLQVGVAGTAASTAHLIFEGNQSNAHLKSPLILAGVYGARISGNILSGYNSRGIFNSVVDGNSGAYVTDPSREVHFNDNLWGGAVNNLGATNNAKYGVVGDGTATGSTSSERGILGLGGGSLVSGTDFSPQTYPT